MTTDAGRILTTHTGSLPRPAALLAALHRHDQAALAEPDMLADGVTAAVDAVVSQQMSLGLDIVNDGEMGRASYATYVRHRLTGFSGNMHYGPPAYLDDFPEFRDRLYSGGQNTLTCACCTGAIGLADTRPLAEDIARLQAATARHAAGAAFMTAASPGIIASYHPNRHYSTHAAYLDAIVAAMRHEYRAIVEAGLILQVDCPDLAATRHTKFLALDDDAFVAQAALHVEMLNEALRDLPPDRMRMHICWGNTESPHHRDIALRRILPVVLQARPQGLVLEAANPRHAHEWAVFREVPLPDDKLLIPGVIDSTTNFIEHPDLVAERLERFACAVGRDRVIAGVDCGFDSIAGIGRVDARIAYAKLGSLVEGAAIASRRLWPKCPA